MEGHITLIHNENHIEVDKQKLASKSCYFASLFSHNFNDSHNKEYVINYNITFSTLQNFVEWIQDGEAPTYSQYNSIKVSLIKFIKHNFIELLNLLQLSVLFAADELSDDVTDVIISHWLLPEKIIDIWLLAQELSLKTLQDVCLSVCLDRFEELPVPLLTELTKDNITQLIANVNVRSSIEYLNLIRNEWMKCHRTLDIMEMKDKRELKFIHGTVIYNMCESVDKDAFLYTWNGNDLSKCIQLKNRDSGSEIIGMQVASRGNWTKCTSKMPESFTEVPPHCVFNGKLFLLKSSIYIYSIETNDWQIISIENPARQSIAFLTHDRTLFSTGEYLGEMVLSRIDAKVSVCEKGDCLQQCVEHRVINIMDTVPVHQDDSYRIRYVCVSGFDLIILNTDRDEKHQYLHLHTQRRKDFENCFIPTLRCISIIDPNTLYDTV
ncbi:uncharacterized protein LOC117608226 isoform X3 [Osmia lignaria lignaria]|uniref:uncharacterized protein LOC117608226 isoform X3 n=1 Tax=Osmia lignaria lignaria TaxID=1437193 RepID=UPI00402B5FF3